MEMTFGVQMLMIASIAVAFIDWFVFPLRLFLSLSANWWYFLPGPAGILGIYQLFTYQFLHQGFGHLLANMLGLYFLGPEIERALGTRRFFVLYFLSGMLGGLGWSLLSSPGFFCVGASGAVFGILGAYAALYPNRELILIFLPFVPFKAWFFVLVIGAWEFTHTLAGPGGHVANAAHLSGGIAGCVFAAVVSHPDLLHGLRRRFSPPPVDRVEIDRILDKAAQYGIHTLTRRERDLLKRAGKR